MKITQDVRDYAAKHGLESARATEEGMRKKAGEFKEAGGEIYVEGAAPAEPASAD